MANQNQPPPQNQRKPPRSTRSRAQARQSTFDWIKRFKQADETMIVDKLDSFVPPDEPSSCDVDTTELEQQPVNILVLGGGGLRGYAEVGMVGGLLELNGGEDFLQYFDLLGGTSAGGVIAMIMNHYTKITEENVDKGERVFDAIFEESFSKRSWRRLFSHASLTDDNTSLSTTYRKLFGEIPLYNPSSINTFALSTVRNKESADAGMKAEPEPFVFRTYDLPPEQDEIGFEVCAGSSDVLFWEALGATSACPVLVDRIDLDINGELMRFVDGGVISNHPVAVALTEAFRLWPRRPIGTVVMLGSDGHCPPEVLKAVTAAKRTNPDMEFVSFTPPVDVHALLESQQTRLKDALIKAKKFIVESKEARALMAKLRLSNPRHRKGAVDPAVRRSTSFATLWRPRRISCQGKFFKNSDTGSGSSFLRSFVADGDCDIFHRDLQEDEVVA